METTAAIKLPPRWTTLGHYPAVAAAINSPHRFNVIPAGRRSLKTETRKRKLVQRALLAAPSGLPGRYFAAAPTYAQARRIYWNDLCAMVPEWALVNKSASNMELHLRNGSMIAVVGMDKPERIEGSPWDGGVLDEFANMKPETWGAHVRPALADRMGWCDLIGVPEGRNHYYERAQLAQAMMQELGADSDWGFYTWPSALVLPPEEIEAAKRDLDLLTFQQEYEASFVNFSGRAYYAFTDANKGKLDYHQAGDLIFTLDFNVSPGTASVLQEQELPNGEIGTGVIGEVHIPQNSNTEAVCAKLIQDWGEHQGRVWIYGDATGGARGSAKVAGSDWDLAKKALYGHYGKQRTHFRVPKSNPAERARINAVNTRCRAGDGTIRLMADPYRAPNVVKDFEGVRVLDGGSGQIDKKADPKLSHLTDGIGYYVNREFPTTERSVVTRPFKVV